MEEQRNPTATDPQQDAETVILRTLSKGGKFVDTDFFPESPYNPKFDPNSPEFDKAAWEEHLQQLAPAMEATKASIQESATHITQDYLKQFEIPEESLRKTLEETRASIPPEEWQGPEPAEMIANLKESTRRIKRTQAFLQSIDLVALLEYMRLPVHNIAETISSGGQSQENIVNLLHGESLQGYIDNWIHAILETVESCTLEELEELKKAVEGYRKPATDENQLTLFEEPPKEIAAKEPAAIRKINLAIAEGAIVKFDSAAFPTAENLLNALTRDSIFFLPSGIDPRAFDERGHISQLELTNKIPGKIDEAQTGLFGAILNSVLTTYTEETQENNTVIVYIPELLRALKIDVRPYSNKRKDNIPLAELRYKKTLELLQNFDRMMGKLPDGSFYRFLTIESYNPESETMRIFCPYLFEIVRRNDSNRYTFLAHPDIANERNKAAVEIAMALLQGLAKRGTSTPDASTYKSKAKPKKKTIKTTAPDGSKTTIVEEYPEAPQEQPDPGRPATFTYEYSYKNFILERCPQLHHELEKIDQRTGKQAKTAKQAYNAKLKQTFSAAFRILMEKTDAPLYYKGLHFTNVYSSGEYILPTKSTLATTYIGLQHNGRNRDYKKNA